MKKTLLSVLMLLAISATAQINTNNLAALSALSASVQIQVATAPGVHVYTVTVPDQGMAVLSGAQRDGESEADYVRRAFLAGAVGLMNQKAGLEARRAALAGQLAATDAKLKADITKATAEALARQALLTNALNAVQSQLK